MVISYFMCLVAFALNQHPDYPLILIANRDEFFDRPTQSLHQWHDDRQIYGGRDLEANGTWLAINQQGRWAALTNFRNPQQSVGHISRGQIVHDCLRTELSLSDWFNQLQLQATHYSGFNLVAGEAQQGTCFFYSNVETGIKTFSTGVHAISNGKYNDEWPKMRHLRETLGEHIKDNNLAESPLFNTLKNRNQPAKAHLPDTGIPKPLEEKLAVPFIKPFSIDGRKYGTRSSAIIKINQSYNVAFCERNMSAQGKKETDYLINLSFSLKRPSQTP